VAESKQKSILAWADSASAGTGYGVVARHVLGALHATGKYKIDQLAINFHGDFVDKNDVPWEMQPARLLDPRDPHGTKMFFRTLMKKHYDIVWILNDLYVTTKVAHLVEKVREGYLASGRKPPVFVYYYPVDCHVKPDAVGMLDAADYSVCYTKHGREETLKTKPELASRLVEIPHGVDTSVFRPLTKKDIAIAKHKYFKASPDTFIVVQVNRNSTRKQIPYSMLAFKEFKKIVPNSMMYIHTKAVDQGGELPKVVQDLQMESKRDFIFPGKYSPTKPVPPHILNNLYNTGDLFLSCHLGEGWGLSLTEAMAAGVPVVTGNNTCMQQQFGDNSERGYMYECRDSIHIDSSGFRPKGLIPDIVEKMVEVYEAGPKQQNPKVVLARDWAVQHDWKEVTKKWVELFDNLELKGEGISDEVITQEV